MPSSRSENASLQTQIVELQQQLAETNILSALVDFARANPENRYQAAAVISRDPSPFLKYVIINRGSDHGLRRGMPVVTQQGLVGRVAAVTAGAARIQLLTDPGSTVNVRLEPSQAAAVLTGSISGDLSLDMIPQGADVQAGNLVLTSGSGRQFPRQYPRRTGDRRPQPGPGPLPAGIHPTGSRFQPAGYRPCHHQLQTG